MSSRFLIPILILPLALAACSEDSTTPASDPEILLTLELNAFFMEAFADQGTVFASDAEGNVLDVATWDGPSTVVLKNSAVQPDTISFTFVQSNDRGLELATEMGVPTGTTWTYTWTLFPAQSGEAQIGLANVPLHDGFRIASDWSSASGPGNLPHQRTIPVYRDSADCFVRIDPLTSPPVGGWLRGLYSGGVFTFDFDEPGLAAPLTPTQVQLPAGGDRLTYNVSRYASVDSFRYVTSFEHDVISEMLPRSLTVYTPECDPADLHTMFYQKTDGDPGFFYQQESTGPVPGEFTKMAGGLTVTSTSPDSLTFTTDSDWDRFTVTWLQNKYFSVQWYVEGPAPIQGFALPKLPPEISEQHPEYPVEGFDLFLLEISKDAGDGRVLSQGKSFPVIGPGGELLSDNPEKAPRGAFRMTSQH